MTWFEALHWAFIKNSKKPITGKDGGIFNNTNWVPTVAEGNLPGEMVLNHAKGADQEAYILEVVPILSTSKPQLSFASTEISASSKLDNYNFANPSTDPQVQQGLNANIITNIGTVIATSLAIAMTNSNKKKTFVSKKATAMIKLMGSSLALNKNKDEVLILDKLTNEMNQVWNTKNKHKATIGFQSHLTATANNLKNSPNLGLTSMYMDANTKTYNIVRVEKLKTFNFLNTSLNSAYLVYDTVITLFN